MRKYPSNSPEAAARIVALTIVADGEVDRAEFALLDELQVHQQLGLSREALHEVIDDFCVDLLASKQLIWADSCPVDEYTLHALMAEIDSPLLQRKVLGLCVKIAEVDGRLSVGESMALHAAVEHWRLQRHMLASSPAMACEAH